MYSRERAYLSPVLHLRQQRLEVVSGGLGTFMAEQVCHRVVDVGITGGADDRPSTL